MRHDHTSFVFPIRLITFTLFLISLQFFSCVPSPYEYYGFLDQKKLITIDTKSFEVAWLSHGLPEVSKCPAVREALVTADQFKSSCGKISCYDPRFAADPGAHNLECAFACGRLIQYQTPLMFFTIGTGKEEPGHSHRVEQAHETFHAWAFCTKTPGGDANHQNDKIWKGALGDIKSDGQKL